jgi:hypothetical protein
MTKPVFNGTLDRCEEYIKRHKVTCDLYTVFGECEKRGIIEDTMGSLSFYMDSFPREADAVNALSTYVDSEVIEHLDEFWRKGYDHVYTYIEKVTYKDGALEDVTPGYIACMDYYKKEG